VIFITNTGLQLQGMSSFDACFCVINFH